MRKLPNLPLLRLRAFPVTCLLILLGFVGSVQAKIPAEERAALIDLYNSTNGSSWNDNNGWWLGIDGTECGWFGVNCQNDHVISLNLTQNQLSGTLPPSLGQLRNLQRLNLGSNQLSGVIPASLGQLSNLQGLGLYQNQLSGAIPDSLGQLSNLQYLELYENQLSGQIPASLGQLTNLLGLGLYRNQLSGAIPSSLGLLSNLQDLNLGLNQLSGPIPASLGQLTNLQGLGLYQNQLSGAVPASLGQLSNLHYLNLGVNQLSGAMPTDLGQLGNLLNLGLHDNQLSGTIPNELLKLTKLESFGFSSSNCLTTNNPALIAFLNRFDSNWQQKQAGKCSVNPDTQVNLASKLIAWGSFVEPNNQPIYATPLLVNDYPLYQMFYNADDEDWFEFNTKAGQRYTINIPATSVGNLINPVMVLYDAAGKVLVNPVSSQVRQIVWTATTSALLRVHIKNQAVVLAKINSAEDASNYAYQIRVFLTDAPQQGIIKGRVLENCNQQGINEAEVSAWLAGGLTDSTLTYKTGEFGLPLNPDSYDLKSLAANYQEASKPVTVIQEDITPVQLELTPTNICVKGNPSALDPIVQAQQASAVYDDQQGILIIRDLIFDNQIYYTELKNLGDYRFQLHRFLLLPGTMHTNAPEYNPRTLIANLPRLFAFNRTWKLQMRYTDDSIYVIDRIEPY